MSNQLSLFSEEDVPFVNEVEIFNGTFTNLFTGSSNPKFNCFPIKL